MRGLASHSACVVMIVAPDSTRIVWNRADDGCGVSEQSDCQDWRQADDTGLLIQMGEKKHNLDRVSQI